MSDHMTLTPPPLRSGLCIARVNLNLVVFLLDSLLSDGSCTVNVDGKMRVFTSVDGGMMPPPPPSPPPLCVCYSITTVTVLICAGTVHGPSVRKTIRDTSSRVLISFSSH